MINSEIVLSGGYSEYHALYDSIVFIAESEGYSNVCLSMAFSYLLKRPLSMQSSTAIESERI